MPMRNLSNTELRIWQQKLLDNISSPSDCEVIWVMGQTGNEGKTWFQEYPWIRKSGATLFQTENSKYTTCIIKTTAEYEGYLSV